MSIKSNLYPPIFNVSSYTFLNNQTCKIYFSISSYNNFDSIKSNVQISVTNQTNNLSALLPAYTEGIILRNAKKDNNGYYVELSKEDMNDSKFAINTYYKVQLRFTDKSASLPSGNMAQWLKDNSDYFSEWSKILLIRGLSPISLTTSIFSSYEISKDKYRYIYRQPFLNFYGNIFFDDDEEKETLKNYALSLYRAEGVIDGEESSNIEADTLSYVLEERGATQTVDKYGNGRDINYSFVNQLDTSTYYRINVDIETVTGFKATFIYYYLCLVQYSTDSLDIDELIISADDEFGRVKIECTVDTDADPYINKFLTFFRTSSESNFTVWEPVKTLFVLPTIEELDESDDSHPMIEYIGNNVYAAKGEILRHVPNPDDPTITEEIIEEFDPVEPYYYIIAGSEAYSYSWYDSSVKSGMFYKYRVQGVEASLSNSGEAHTKAYTAPIYSKTKIPKRNGGYDIIEDEPLFVCFDYMFLSADNCHLKVKYNPKVTSYKTNVTESKTDTIGSKYPYFRRGGAARYKQFSISGLISFLSDEDAEKYAWDNDANSIKATIDGPLFANDRDLYQYDEIINLYKTQNDKLRISKYNDFIKERMFREKVVEFLYNDNVKLLRTLTEGNILVKLMDINLSPEQSLGNYVYSFSATAYEIDEATLGNIYKYSCITIPQNISELPEIDYLIEQFPDEFSPEYGQMLGMFELGKDILA